jgi:hypothetical protein
MLIAAGCATKEPVRLPQPPPAEPVPMESQAYVRTGEIVKAYPVSRYVDPGNPEVMHERHVIYRVERSNAWRLTPPNNRYDMTLLGPVAGVRQPYYKDSPLPAEIGRELRKQAEITRSMASQSASLEAAARAAIEEAQTATAQMREQAQSAEQLEAMKKAIQDKLDAQLKDIRSQMEQTEKRVATLNAEAKDDDEGKAQPSPSSSPQPTPTEEEWMKAEKK